MDFEDDLIGFLGDILKAEAESRASHAYPDDPAAALLFKRSADEPVKPKHYPRLRSLSSIC